ncbi:TM2 domain-containing protein [Paenarthrobacter sp. NPDC089322]|uniref:TM2 domain-containing protein n=1 Tax=Paenarthrobacter sp. NPDC089322 TaxID=3155065 RepID=UPI003419A8F6
MSQDHQPNYTPPPPQGYQPPQAYQQQPYPGQNSYTHPFQQPAAPQKSFLVTWLLALLVGVFGVDRFYLGKVGTGIAKLLTIGGLGVWALVDLILVLANKQTDKHRRPLEGYDKHKVVALIVTAVFVVASIALNATRATTAPATLSPAPAATTAPTVEPTASEAGTRSEAPAATSTPAPVKTSEAPAPAAPKVKTQTFTGAGDDIVTADLAGEPAIVTFACELCSSNTVLKTNGRESLLVNTIGAYAGKHVVDTRSTSVTSEFEINADAAWTLSIEDITTIAPSAGPVSGRGDQVVLLSGKSTKATITHQGEGNFVVQGYGGSYPELAVNEIGSYSGTVKLTGPGFVQVNAEGDWTITPG